MLLLLQTCTTTTSCHLLLAHDLHIRCSYALLVLCMDYTSHRYVHHERECIWNAHADNSYALRYQYLEPGTHTLTPLFSLHTSYFTHHTSNMDSSTAPAWCWSKFLVADAALVFLMCPQRCVVSNFSSSIPVRNPRQEKFLSRSIGLKLLWVENGKSKETWTLDSSSATGAASSSVGSYLAPWHQASAYLKTYLSTDWHDYMPRYSPFDDSLTNFTLIACQAWLAQQ